jgi:ribose transport system substrate-binding protein
MPSHTNLEFNPKQLAKRPASALLLSRGHCGRRNEIKTYGVDGSPDVVALVKDSNSGAAAVAAQQPYLIGKTAVDNAARYLNGDHELPPYTFVQAVLVTKHNADEMQKFLGQRP